MGIKALGKIESSRNQSLRIDRNIKNIQINWSGKLWVSCKNISYFLIRHRDDLLRNNYSSFMRIDYLSFILERVFVWKYLTSYSTVRVILVNKYRIQLKEEWRAQQKLMKIKKGIN
jgi:hypothetical protein